MFKYVIFIFKFMEMKCANKHVIFALLEFNICVNQQKYEMTIFYISSIV